MSEEGEQEQLVAHESPHIHMVTPDGQRFLVIPASDNARLHWLFGFLSIAVPMWRMWMCDGADEEEDAQELIKRAMELAGSK